MERSGWRGPWSDDPTPPGPRLPAVGARAARAALALKCVTGIGLAARRARVRLAPGQRRLGPLLPGTRAWKALKLRRPGSAHRGALRDPLRASDRPSKAPQGRGVHFLEGPLRFFQSRGR
jgi:hypothetical protein